jgi:hypothetical protein
MADFWLQDHGSIMLLTPRTLDAAQWLDDNLGEHQTWGDAVVVEHRYIADLVEGIKDSGFSIEV